MLATRWNQDCYGYATFLRSWIQRPLIEMGPYLKNVRKLTDLSEDYFFESGAIRRESTQGSLRRLASQCFFLGKAIPTKDLLQLATTA